MTTPSREAAWMLLSALFVDTQNTPEDLRDLGRSLQATGFTVDDVEAILRREVAPVCGEWMRHPGAIGPWPMFEEQELKERIEAHLRKSSCKPPWLRRPGLLLPSGVRREWKLVRDGMRGPAST
jgi:hypothetical protein